MGGASTDIWLIVEGRPSLAAARRAAGHTIALSSPRYRQHRHRRRSIARVDAGGILHAGPESAGTFPGPACDGGGGAATNHARINPFFCLV
jgi:N-methylhydantoinase A